MTVVAWSTREIAELAGTSLRAVRHYHEVGLLEEPERRANGYKKYGVSHLVQVLRVKRLTDLGFSLSQIAEMGDASGHPAEALRMLDAELAATIEKLQRARMELSTILHRSAPTDLPVELTPGTGVRMTEADRSLVVVLSRVLGPRGMQTYSDLMRDPADDPASAEFDDLPADADEDTRQGVAERLAPFVRTLRDQYPGLTDTHSDAPGGARFAAETMVKAMKDLYNPAQLDVLVRINTLVAAPAR